MKVAVYARDLRGLGGGAKHGLLLLEPLIGIHDITVFHHSEGGIDSSVLREQLGIDLSGVRFETLDYEWGLARVASGCDLLLNVTFASLARSRAAKGILMVFFPLPLDDISARSPLAALAHGVRRVQDSLLEYVDRCEPGIGLRSFADYWAQVGAKSLLRLPLFLLRKLAWTRSREYRLGRAALGSYDVLLVNSAYTAGWTRSYYACESVISYPPIEVDRFHPGAKEPVVLSVGRFEPGAMSKKHHVLLDVFKELHDEGTLRGWRMKICGGSDGSEEFGRYTEQLRRAAEGYPISISVNLPLQDLQDLYGRASLYWHAMGYGEDPEQHPWRFEHFGMTTAEAMAAGCIPMVIAAGGQTEIVEAGKNGFLWRTLEELKIHTRNFIGIPESVVDRMRADARRRASDFGPYNFRRRTAQVYQSLGIPCRMDLGDESSPADPTDAPTSPFPTHP